MSANMQHRIDFSSDAKLALRQLGVTQRQVEKLEAAMFFAKDYLVPRAAPRDVRDFLDNVQRPLALLQRAFKRVAHGKTPASIEAGNWLAYYLTRDPELGRAQGFDDLPRPDHRKELLAHVEAAVQGMWACRMAAAEVAGRRKRRIEIFPIYLIDAALRNDGETGHPAIRVSKAPSSVFSQIVSICIAQTVGEPERDHERAIKAYIKDRSEVEESEDSWDRDNSDLYY